MEPDLNNPIPLHHQISNILEKEILFGKFTDKIPSERELMDRFSVSRSTIREAVARLVHEGKLTKVHGKGTFIQRVPPLHDWLHSLNSFTEVVKKMGLVPSSKLLQHGSYAQPQEIANALGVKQFYSIQRLRYANDIPVAIEQHYYTPEIGKKLSVYDLNVAVIYELLENALGIQLWEADQIITSRHASDEEAAYLSIAPYTCMLCVERTIRDESGRIVELYKGIYRPDLYQFRIKTKRK